jgi:hypothetical protein
MQEPGSFVSTQGAPSRSPAAAQAHLPASAQAAGEAGLSSTETPPRSQLKTPGPLLSRLMGWGEGGVSGSSGAGSPDGGSDPFGSPHGRDPLGFPSAADVYSPAAWALPGHRRKEPLPLSGRVLASGALSAASAQAGAGALRASAAAGSLEAEGSFASISVFSLGHGEGAEAGLPQGTPSRLLLLSPATGPGGKENACSRCCAPPGGDSAADSAKVALPVFSLQDACSTLALSSPPAPTLPVQAPSQRHCRRLIPWGLASAAARLPLIGLSPRVSCAALTAPAWCPAPALESQPAHGPDWAARAGRRSPAHVPLKLPTSHFQVRHGRQGSISGWAPASRQQHASASQGGRIRQQAVSCSGTARVPIGLCGVPWSRWHAPRARFPAHLSYSLPWWSHLPCGFPATGLASARPSHGHAAGPGAGRAAEATRGS